MSDNIQAAHVQIFTWYAELYRRRMATYQMVNGIYGRYLSEKELREITDEVCNAIRFDCKLDEQTHAYLKRGLLDVLFGAKKQQWVKK